ncbi:MAG: acyltransferase family protein [Caulobacteraceae bacterium]
MPPRERLLSLDIVRGLAIIGMIVVNSAAYLKSLGGYGAYPVLLHSAWAGFTAADAVFPAFIFIAGASIPLAAGAPGGSGLDGAQARRIGGRMLRLILAGLIISNLYFLADPATNPFRPMGVLQRIALAWAVSAALFRLAGPGTRLALAVTLLIAYWPLTLAPSPDGVATNLTIPGANFVSWFDRLVLGGDAFVRGPLGFDPEGLLSTLPTIAQCLFGVACGEWLLRRRSGGRAALSLAAAGLGLGAAGLAWAAWFPPVKALWTSSYVLISTGVVLVVFAAIFWVIDIRQWRPWGWTVAAAFGMNAIFAYILHELASIALAGQWMRALYGLSLRLLRPEAAALVCVAIFTAMIWLPVAYLRRRGWIIRI